MRHKDYEAKCVRALALKRAGWSYRRIAAEFGYRGRNSGLLMVGRALWLENNGPEPKPVDQARCHGRPGGCIRAGAGRFWKDGVQQSRS